MKYNPPLKAQLREALFNAFPNPGELELLASDTSEDLKMRWRSLAGSAESEENALGRWIDWAESRRSLLLVIEVALSKNGDHPELQRVSAAFEPILDPLRQLDADLGAVEKLVLKNVQFQDVGVWISKLDQIRRAVCRIESGPDDDGRNGFGTGFLVGPDLILTNWHVAESFWGGEKEIVAKARARFGYETNAAGNGSRDEEYGLSPDWSLRFSKTEDRDFALLRLDRPATMGGDGKPRVPLKLRDQYEFEASEPLLILQHPRAQPLKLAIGAFDPRADGRDQFFWHKVNTEPGSSGAPCLNHNLEVVGVHHYGEVERNRGVKAAEIASRIEEDLKLSGLETLSNGVGAPTPEPRKRAFVIQAVGGEGSRARRRANKVFEALIRPACEEAGYLPILAHELKTATITEPIISELSSGQMVIADLGGPDPYWNANVMIEVGFRLATGRPIVVLADKEVGDAEFPLHLRNLRRVPIDLENPSAAREELVDRIEANDAKVARRGWRSQFPFVEYCIGAENETRTVYRDANSKAARIYGVESPDEIIGRPVIEVNSRVYGYMSPSHRKRLEEDQSKHYGRIWHTRPHGVDLEVEARVPLWFTDDHPFEEQRGKLYLPVISHYKEHKDEDSSIIMRSVFIDITDWKLGDLSIRDPEDVRVPNLFRGRRLPYEVFLPYDSGNAEHGSEIRSTLEKCGLRSWNSPDLENRPTNELIEGMSRSRVFVLPIGREGFGQWSNPPEVQDVLVRFQRAGTPCLLLLLPDAGEDWREKLPSVCREHFDSAPSRRVASLEELRSLGPGNGPSIVEWGVRELIKLRRRVEKD